MRARSSIWPSPAPRVQRQPASHPARADDREVAERREPPHRRAFVLARTPRPCGEITSGSGGGGVSRAVLRGRDDAPPSGGRRCRAIAESPVLDLGTHAAWVKAFCLASRRILRKMRLMLVTLLLAVAGTLVVDLEPSARAWPAGREEEAAQVVERAEDRRRRVRPQRKARSRRARGAERRRSGHARAPRAHAGPDA